MFTNNALFAILGSVKEWLSLSCHYSCNLICHACRAHKDSFAAPSDLKNQHRHDLASFLAESVKLDELRRVSVQIGSLFLLVVLLHLGFVKKRYVFGFSTGFMLVYIMFKLDVGTPTPQTKNRPSSGPTAFLTANDSLGCYAHRQLGCGFMGGRISYSQAAAIWYLGRFGYGWGRQAAGSIRYLQNLEQGQQSSVLQRELVMLFCLSIFMLFKFSNAAYI